MTREGDNNNDEHYVPIKNKSFQTVVQTNLFEEVASISLGILTCKKTLRPGSIETIKNELENLSIFKATMDQMDLISCNSDDGSINLVDPRIIAAETSQKDNLHFG